MKLKQLAGAAAALLLALSINLLGPIAFARKVDEACAACRPWQAAQMRAAGRRLVIAPL